MKGALIALVAVVVIGLGILFGVMGWYDTGVGLQETTLAQYRDNQNKYDSFWKSVQEMAQIPAKYKEDFKDILVTETQAKFGPQGSQAMMQWFKERQLTLPPEVYTKVQTAIEAGRADFKRGQQMLIDKQRSARQHRLKLWGKFCLIFTDFLDEIKGELQPPKDLDGDGKYTILDYDIVTSKQTKAAFETGEAEAINVFGPK